MIREFNNNDIPQINFLLKPFNYNIYSSIENNTFFKCIVYDDKKIKGVLVYDLIYDRIEIEYIIVYDRYRRKGIGSKLLKYLIEQNKDIKNITLEVRSSNIPAIKLYENNGFEKVTLRKNYYKNEDGILMIKKKVE